MRKQALITLFALLTPSAAFAQKDIPLSAAMEKCLRTNAAGVEQAIDDLAKASDFLASNLR